MALYEIERARLSALKGEGDYMHPVFGEGTPGARLVLIGEAPGAQEAAAGRPFVGKAGKQLDALLDCVGLKRGDIFITNAVKFRPTNHDGRSNRTPTGGEMREGLALLRDELELIAPRIVATLGNVPYQSLQVWKKLLLGKRTAGKLNAGNSCFFRCIIRRASSITERSKPCWRPISRH
jgi:DNA polymerase